MSVRVLPFLMFEGHAEAAMRLWVATVPNSEIVEIEHYSAEGPGREGSVARALVKVGGQQVRCFDSHVRHDFTFTPSFSFFVDCESQAQHEAIWAALIDGGSALMPPDNYGFSRWFGWLQDQFGVSWQLNLP